MSHTPNTPANYRTCEYASVETCHERAHVLVALLDGPTYALCVDHSADLLEQIPDDEIADVVDFEPREAREHNPNVVQSLQCVGYELLVVLDGAKFLVRPSYAIDPLIAFDTYREAMEFAVERCVVEFEHEVQL